MSLKDELIAARALIDTPEYWCQRAPGIMRNGHPAYCAYIAIADAAEWGSRVEAREAFARALPLWWRVYSALHGISVDQSVIWFNDRKRTTHNHIMRAFDRAIEAAP
jgi:hypothetical protein